MFLGQHFFSLVCLLFVHVRPSVWEDRRSFLCQGRIIDCVPCGTMGQGGQGGTLKNDSYWKNWKIIGRLLVCLSRVSRTRETKLHKNYPKTTQKLPKLP